MQDPDCASPSDVNEATEGAEPSQRPRPPPKEEEKPSARSNTAPRSTATPLPGEGGDGQRHPQRQPRRNQRRRWQRRRRQGAERDRRWRPAAGRRQRRRLPVRRRRDADDRQPDDDDRALRPGPDRGPQLRHRLVRDPALPAADLPGLRNRIRDPLGGAGLDQQNRDRLRHQPQRLQRRRRRLDAVPALELGSVRAGCQRRRSQRPLQPGRRDLRRGALSEDRRRRQRPLRRDPRLQPRRLVRAGGPALRPRLRPPPLRPGRLADRADRRGPLPDRRRRPLRRRRLGPGGAEEPLDQLLRQRRRSDLLLPDPARDQHLRRRGSAGRRRQRRHHPQARRERQARQVHRPRRHLRQPLHLRRARQDHPRPALGGDADRQGEAAPGRKPGPAAAAAGAARQGGRRQRRGRARNGRKRRPRSGRRRQARGRLEGDRRHRPGPGRRQRRRRRPAHQLLDPAGRTRRPADRPEADPRRLEAARGDGDLPRQGQEPVHRPAQRRRRPAALQGSAAEAGAGRRRALDLPLRPRRHRQRADRPPRPGDARVPALERLRTDDHGAGVRPQPT